MKVSVLGVPDSAGAYCVGTELAPRAIREAGLLDVFRGAEIETVDAGDLTMRSWSPDPASPLVQNVDEEVAALIELSEAAASLLRSGERLLVLGGSCTVAVGVCAAMVNANQQPRLVYIDRHLDLNTPQSTTEGSLSWMGMAHALALEGSAPQLTALTGHSPLLHPADLVYLGADPSRETTEHEREHATALGLKIIDQEELCSDPGAAARHAHDLLPGGPFVVHLDVDVLDFLDAPIAENVNGRNSGPTIDQISHALRALVQQPDCWGLTIGQLDPHHASADPTAIPRLITALASAFTTV